MSTGETKPDSARLLDCDLVMKGGITSGVVYPKAVVRLAQAYRIRNVGGTSVGAIAAALTAAAEYFRQERIDPVELNLQRDEIATLVHVLEVEGWNFESEVVKFAESPFVEGRPGFAGLYAIPRELGENLLDKFVPQPGTASLFGYIARIMEARRFPGKLLASLFRGFYVARWIGAFCFMLLALAIVSTPATAFYLAAPVFAVVVVLIVFSRVPAAGADRNLAQKAFPKSRALLVLGILALLYVFGVVLAGILLSDATISVGESVRTLGRMIRDTLGAIADPGSWWERLREDVGPHLGLAGALGNGFIIGWIVGGGVALLYHLTWSVPRNFLGICTGLGGADALTNWLVTKIDTVAGTSGRRHLTFGDLDRHGIAFEAITSDLTRGAPLDLPAAFRSYRFKPVELSQFFPVSVLRQLDVAAGDESSGDLHSFPHWKQIPIVVAARMSMSFPLLFSALPMYRYGAIDQRSWLSDGGIVSNFPVHKFDRALPPWPTFALDLIDRKGRKPSSIRDQISVAPIGSPMTSAPAGRRTSELGITDLIGLASGILNTARGWMDNAQKSLPGYAERIVGIHLYPGEGGLNLRMDSGTISDLANRGMVGADWLVIAWNPAASPAGRANEWNQHRWLRYRILMRELEEMGREWRWIYDNHAPGDWRRVQNPTIAALVARSVTGDNEPAGYRYNWQRQAAAKSAQNLTTSYDAFAHRAADGGPFAVVEDESDAEAARLGAIVFERDNKPSLNPKWFMIPPFH